MDIKEVLNKIEKTPIDNFKQIAKYIIAKNIDEYASLFAKEVVKQKIENSNISFEEFNDNFPYLLNINGGVLIGSTSKFITGESSPSKKSLEQYARKLKQATNGYEIIQFLPYQMNGNNVRKILKNYLNIDFVNLPYNQKSIEEKFRMFGSGTPKYY